MAKKKAATKTAVAIEVRGPETVPSLLAAIANKLSKPLPPKELAAVHVGLLKWGAAVEELEKECKAQTEALLRERGHQTTEKGALEYEADGIHFEARPWRTTLDAKKVEAGLRALGIDPEHGMDATISYLPNLGKLLGLKLPDGLLESWKYDLKLVVQKPRPIDE